MAEQQKDKDLAADQRPVPSKAEGEDTNEAPPKDEKRPVPSQAEGERK
jgi:hypothetical protein